MFNKVLCFMYNKKNLFNIRIKKKICIIFSGVKSTAKTRLFYYYHSMKSFNRYLLNITCFHFKKMFGLKQTYMGRDLNSGNYSTNMTNECVTHFSDTVLRDVYFAHDLKHVYIQF